MRRRNGLVFAAVVVGCSACVAQSHVGTSGPELSDELTPSPTAASPPPTAAPVPPVVQPATPPSAAPARAMSRITIDNDPRERLGEQSQIVGDIDGDGYDDFLLLGRRTEPIPEDAVEEEWPLYAHSVAYLFYGREQLPSDLSTVQADAAFRGNIAGVNGLDDVNGDGLADFSLYGSSGVDIVLGRAQRWQGETAPDAAGVHWTGPELPELFRDADPMHVERAGDVNGDGYADVFVHVVDKFEVEDLGGGSSFGRWRTRIHLLFGRAEWRSGAFDSTLAQATFSLETADAWTSPWPLAAGDLDGDGYDDIIVWLYDSQYLYYGGASAFAGTIGEAQAAVALLSESGAGYPYPLGDLDGDGRADLVVVGREGVDVIYGRAQRWSQGDPPVASLRIEHSFDGDVVGMLGAGVASDIDGDGHPDLVLVQPARVTSQPNGGDRSVDVVYVVRGSSTRLEGTLVLGREHVFAEGLFLDLGGFAQSYPGVQLDAGGDIDGDGSTDMLIGAPNSGGLEDVENENSGKVLLFARTPIEPQ